MGGPDSQAPCSEARHEKDGVMRQGVHYPMLRRSEAREGDEESTPRVQPSLFRLRRQHHPFTPSSNSATHLRPYGLVLAIERSDIL